MADLTPELLAQLEEGIATASRNPSDTEWVAVDTALWVQPKGRILPAAMVIFDDTVPEKLFVHIASALNALPYLVAAAKELAQLRYEVESLRCSLNKILSRGCREPPTGENAPAVRASPVSRPKDEPISAAEELEF